ncbi:MAG TPA: hypothetical protein PKL30_21900 [Leptospiraceae bacterium]|nr:hypothetical protein [Leptospiraceae bacterium]
MLFAFFMITDPKTIPDHKIGRILHAFLVAMFSYIWAFVFFKTNPYIWALFISSPVVIFWDYLLKAEKYKWKLEN